MKYLKLNSSGTKWININYDINISDYKQVKIYDDNLNFVGIGLY